MNTIEILGREKGGTAEILIDNKRLEKVTSYSLQQLPGEPAELEVSVYGVPQIIAHGTVKVSIDVQSIQDACAVLRRKLIDDREFYGAFHSCIVGALREMPNGVHEDKAALMILDRIIGNE